MFWEEAQRWALGWAPLGGQRPHGAAGGDGTLLGASAPHLPRVPRILASRVPGSRRPEPGARIPRSWPCVCQHQMLPGPAVYIFFYIYQTVSL